VRHARIRIAWYALPALLLLLATLMVLPTALPDDTCIIIGEVGGVQALSDGNNAKHQSVRASMASTAALPRPG